MRVLYFFALANIWRSISAICVLPTPPMPTSAASILPGDDEFAGSNIASSRDNISFRPVKNWLGLPLSCATMLSNMICSLSNEAGVSQMSVGRLRELPEVHLPTWPIVNPLVFFAARMSVTVSTSFFASCSRYSVVAILSWPIFSQAARPTL